jgi:hypothetical protein
VPASYRVIDAVTGAPIHAQLPYALANRFAVDVPMLVVGGA